MHGILVIALVKPILWEENYRMSSGFTTCLGMYGSGAGIGMKTTQQTHLLITVGQALALTAFFAGVVGATMPLAAPSPTGTTATRMTGTTAGGSVFCAQFSRLK